MDKPMDETDRKHCLLDLHNVGSDPVLAVKWVAKWISGLESILAEMPEDERIDPDDVAEIEGDLRAAKNENHALTMAVEDALDQVERADIALTAAKEALEKVAK